MLFKKQEAMHYKVYFIIHLDLYRNIMLYPGHTFFHNLFVTLYSVGYGFIFFKQTFSLICLILNSK